MRLLGIFSHRHQRLLGFRKSRVQFLELERLLSNRDMDIAAFAEGLAQFHLVL